MKNRVIAVLMLISFGNLLAETPYKLSWNTDGYLIGAGLGLIVATEIVNDSIKPLTSEDIKKLNKNDINSFDRISTNNFNKDLGKISDIMLVGAAASPLLLLAGESFRNDFTTVGTMYLETLIYAGFLTNLTKGLVLRTRPYNYNEDVPIADKLSTDARLSYFSGHTAVTFASTVFIAKVYSDFFPDSKYTPYMYGGAIAISTTVGLLRIFSGNHFPTDVISGAIVGTICGYFIPEFHKAANQEINKTTMRLVPEANSISFSVRF